MLLPVADINVGGYGIIGVLVIIVLVLLIVYLARRV